MRDDILLNDRVAALADQLVPVLGYFGWFLEVVLGHLPLVMLAYGSRAIQLSYDHFALLVSTISKITILGSLIPSSCVIKLNCSI